MFLTRRYWAAYTSATLLSFGLTVCMAFYGGFWSSLQFAWGCAWAWNLLTWAGLRSERRRGYRVVSRTLADGEVELRVVVNAK